MAALLLVNPLVAPHQPHTFLDYSWEPNPGVMETVHAFDRFLEEAVRDGQAPGAALAIVHKGRIMLAKGYGVRSEHTFEEVDEHTVFRLASVSKTLSGVLTGKLVEKGVLDWEDHVHEYLPEFCLQSDLHTEDLQLIHLLSHTTGLPYHTYTNLIERGMSMEEMMVFLHNVEQVSKLGEVYSYQNVAFSLIGEVIEETTCKNFEQSLRKELFVPLSMGDASASYEGFMQHGNTAQPHIYLGNKRWRQLRPSPTYYNSAPAGGVNASASDMGQYLRAMLGARPDVVSPAILAEVSTPIVYTPIRYRYFGHWRDVKKSYYGLGWRIVETEEEQMLYHGGYVSGYRSEIAVMPEKELGICVLFNGTTGLASQSIPKFMDLLRASKEVL